MKLDDKNELIVELSNIASNLIGLEAEMDGLEFNENGSLKDGCRAPEDIQRDAYNMFMSAEAAINKSFYGRTIGRLNVFFSLNSDSRNGKRAADLNLLNTASIEPGPSVVKFNKNCVNLYLNALGYTRMQQGDLQNVEQLRTEFYKIMQEPENELHKAFQTYIHRIIIAIPLLVLSVPLTLIWVVVTDILIYYYLILSILATLERLGVVSGGREDFVRLLSAIVKSVYENGSGKTVKLDSNGMLSNADMVQMKNTIEDATGRMNAEFEMCRRGVSVEYDEKVQLVNLLKDNRVMIQSKYSADPMMSRKMTSFYNTYARSVANKHDSEKGYSEYAVRLSNLADLTAAIINNGLSCDRNLTTMVRELYKV